MAISFTKAVVLVEVKILNLIVPGITLGNLKNTSDPIIYHLIAEKSCQQILDILEKDNPCNNNMWRQILTCSTKPLTPTDKENF